jgi:hypothetical protein
VMPKSRQPPNIVRGGVAVLFRQLVPPSIFLMGNGDGDGDDLSFTGDGLLLLILGHRRSLPKHSAANSTLADQDIPVRAPVARTKLAAAHFFVAAADAACCSSSFTPRMRASLSTVARVSSPRMVHQSCFSPSGGPQCDDQLRRSTSRSRRCTDTRAAEAPRASSIALPTTMRRIYTAASRGMSRRPLRHSPRRERV